MPSPEAAAPPFRDARGRGFDAPLPLARAHAWVDRACPPLPAEAVPAARALGRTLAAAAACPAAVPGVAVAARDGWAVASAATLGADPYAPLPLGPAAREVAAGAPLPPGTDAVLAFAATEAGGPAGPAATAPAAPGEGAIPPGRAAEAGAALGAPGRTLSALDLAALRALGVHEVTARRRPRARLLLPGPRAGSLWPDAAAGDLLSALLAALVARDGGEAEAWPADPDGLPAALAGAGGAADLVIVAGRSGEGADDGAAAALAAVARVAFHGLGIRPGGSAGGGTLGDGTPALLLPGEPFAAWAAYELLAGRAVRRLAGRPPGLPHPRVAATAGRKIVSELGLVEACPVRLDAGDGRAHPVPAAEGAHLPAALRADGFLLLPPDSEGFPEGARVEVLAFGPLP